MWEMSLFKLLLMMFNLLRNSKHSSCCCICRAWGVHLILFIRLDNVEWFFSWEVRAFWYCRYQLTYFIYVYINIYISDTLLILCRCVSALTCSIHSLSLVTCWAEGRGVAAPGHLGSIGQEPQNVSGHLGRATVPCQGTGHRAQKA